MVVLLVVFYAEILDEQLIQGDHVICQSLSWIEEKSVDEDPLSIIEHLLEVSQLLLRVEGLRRKPRAPGVDHSSLVDQKRRLNYSLLLRLWPLFFFAARRSLYQSDVS